MAKSAFGVFFQTCNKSSNSQAQVQVQVHCHQVPVQVQVQYEKTNLQAFLSYTSRPIISLAVID